MILFPLLSLLFLIANPVLFWLFNRFNQNLQKLDFWMMVTTGLAWLVSLAFIFFKPELKLNPVWDAGEKLLPSLAFSLDWVSSSIFLIITSLVFFAVLVEGYSPQTNAWITALGAICVVGTFVDSAYSLALIWTAIEALLLYRYLKNQTEISSNHRYVFGILVRLTAPLLAIYVSLIHSETGIAPFFTDLPSSAAPYLLAAGMISFGGWFLGSNEDDQENSVIQSEKYAARIPAVLGLVLMTRAAEIPNSLGSTPGVLVIIGVVFLLIYSAIALFTPPVVNWRIGSLALMVGGYFFGAPDAVLAWGLVFFLPGIILFRRFKSNRTAVLAIIVGGLGIIPLPFFPVWSGLISFLGISGIFFALLAGLNLGKTLNLGIQTLQGGDEADSISPLMITGYSIILVSQYLISIQSDLIKKSLAFSNVPLASWLGLSLFILGSIFWNKIPDLKVPFWNKNLARINHRLGSLIEVLTGFTDQAVYLVSRIFEGDGGLIWTLLFGFLIITLISLRGG